jgi:hypothetical protein
MLEVLDRPLQCVRAVINCGPRQLRDNQHLSYARVREFNGSALKRGRRGLHEKGVELANRWGRHWGPFRLTAAVQQRDCCEGTNSSTTIITVFFFRVRTDE